MRRPRNKDFVSLFYRIQPRPCALCFPCCCKLLSKLYLCSTEYSLGTAKPDWVEVVNCFQNCIFVLPNTAKNCFDTEKDML